MHDIFKRRINYLRISITDKCNLRCTYCMPDDSTNCEKEDILTFDEMEKVVESFAELGINKIRITGGEPLVRKGVIDFLGRISKINGITDLAITTNGVLLPKMAKDLKEAGINRVNISLDSLNKEKYYSITKKDELSKVLDGIRICKEIGLKVKINVVLMKGINEDEISDFVNLTVDNDIDVRFIELMPMGEELDLAKNNFISVDSVIDNVKELKEIEIQEVSSPAKYYKIDDAKGRVGLIKPITGKFCSSCNRVRLTSSGKLRLCLHNNMEINLREHIESKEKLKSVIKKYILEKPKEHELEKEKYTEKNMFQIGG